MQTVRLKESSSTFRRKLPFGREGGAVVGLRYVTSSTGYRMHYWDVFKSLFVQENDKGEYSKIYISVPKCDYVQGSLGCFVSMYFCDYDEELFKKLRDNFDDYCFPFIGGHNNIEDDCVYIVLKADWNDFLNTQNVF